MMTSEGIAHLDFTPVIECWFLGCKEEPFALFAWERQCLHTGDSYVCLAHILVLQGRLSRSGGAVCIECGLPVRSKLIALYKEKK